MEYKIIQELQEYAELDGTEWGDVVFHLINLYQGSHSLVSEKLMKALEKEIIDWHKNAKEYCRIIETEETIVQKIRELEWT